MHPVGAAIVSHPLYCSNGFVANTSNPSNLYHSIACVQHVWQRWNHVL